MDFDLHEYAVVARSQSATNIKLISPCARICSLGLSALMAQNDTHGCFELLKLMTERNIAKTDVHYMLAMRAQEQVTILTLHITLDN
jgi:hypothetical protein